MKTCRELMNESEKRIEKEAKAKRMKTCRELMNESEKKLEKEAYTKNMKANRKRIIAEDGEGFEEYQKIREKD